MAKIEVGRMALRAPDGSFLPSVPIYKDIPDELVSFTIPSEQEGGEPETIVCEFSDSVINMFAKDISKLRIKRRKQNGLY